MGNERVYCVCAQGVDELNMRMGHAPGVEGFVAKLQHAQVSSTFSCDERDLCTRPSTRAHAVKRE
jgi:hypothetical protein